MCCIISYPPTRQFAFFTGTPEKVGHGPLQGWNIVYGPTDQAGCQAAMKRFRPMMYPFTYKPSSSSSTGVDEGKTRFMNVGKLATAFAAGSPRQLPMRQKNKQIPVLRKVALGVVASLTLLAPFITVLGLGLTAAAGQATQLATGTDITDDSGKIGETKTYGPFRTREQAENFARDKGNVSYSVYYWLFYGYYTDVTFLPPLLD